MRSSFQIIKLSNVCFCFICDEVIWCGAMRTSLNGKRMFEKIHPIITFFFEITYIFHFASYKTSNRYYLFYNSFFLLNGSFPVNLVIHIYSLIKLPKKHKSIKSTRRTCKIMLQFLQMLLSKAVGETLKMYMTWLTRCLRMKIQMRCTATHIVG